MQVIVPGLGVPYSDGDMLDLSERSELTFTARCTRAAP
jgi:hypothetical protein